MAKIYKGDIGVLLTVATGLTLTGATTTQLKVKKPSGAIVTWAATIDLTNQQQLNYTTLAGDLDQDGNYFIQPYVVLGTQTLYGETVEVPIYGEFQ